MNKRTNILYWLFFLSSIFLGSCSDAQDQEVEFPISYSLNSQTKNLEGVHLKYPSRIRQQDSLLYILDLHPGKYFCHVFKFPTLELQGSFINRGEAPEELIVAENIRLNSEGSLWALGPNEHKLISYQQNSLHPPLIEIHLAEELIRTLDFDLLDDSTFIVPDYTGEHRINLIDFEGAITDRFFHIPATPASGAKNTLPIVLAQAWRPFIDYNADNGILALVTQLGQVLEIYDLKKKTTINVIKSKEPEFITKGAYAVPDGIMGYSDVHVGKESIYALFWGHSFENIKKGLIRKEGGNTIHVFSLDGTPKIEYKLDAHITGFHINEKDKYILGLDVNSNQPLKKFKYD